MAKDRDEPRTAPQPDRWYNLTLGPSFKHDSSNKYCTLRCKCFGLNPFRRVACLVCLKRSWGVGIVVIGRRDDRCARKFEGSEIGGGDGEEMIALYS